MVVVHCRGVPTALWATGSDWRVPARLTLSRLTMSDWVGGLAGWIAQSVLHSARIQHCTVPHLECIFGWWAIIYLLALGCLSGWVGMHPGSNQGLVVWSHPTHHAPHTIHFSNMTPKCTIHFVLFSLNLDVLTLLFYQFVTLTHLHSNGKNFVSP